MSEPIQDQTFMMWLMGGMSAAFTLALTAICIWVKSIKDDLEEEDTKMQNQISNQNQAQHDSEIDFTTRYATKADLDKLENHINEKFGILNQGHDTIIKLLVGGHGKD